MKDAPLLKHERERQKKSEQQLLMHGKEKQKKSEQLQ